MFVLACVCKTAMSTLQSTVYMYSSTDRYEWQLEVSI